jgi:DNA-binding NarL/FixJ family response regulator
MSTSAAAVASITDFEPPIFGGPAVADPRGRARQLRPVPQPEILAIDPRPLLRSGLARVAHRALGCGAQALPGIEQAYAAARSGGAPRAVLIGIRSGDDADLLVSRARELGAPVVLVLESDDPALARDAIAAHADAYLLADEVDAESIRTAVAAADSADLEGPLIPERMRDRVEQDQAVTAITARCLEVLEALSDGLHDHEIARLLGISTSAVRKHIAGAQERLQARTRTQVIAIAARNGLL